MKSRHVQQCWKGLFSTPSQKIFETLLVLRWIFPLLSENPGSASEPKEQNAKPKQSFLTKTKEYNAKPKQSFLTKPKEQNAKPKQSFLTKPKEQNAKPN